MICLGLVLLFQSSNPSKIISTNVNNTTVTTIPSITKIITNNYYSELNVPKGYTSTENILGSISIPLYHQVITSIDKTMEIDIDTIPKNKEKIKNTGSSDIQYPDKIFVTSLKLLTTLDSVQLYRENEVLKYTLAKKEAERNEPQTYLTQGGDIEFKIYEKASDPIYPYKTPFKTNNNESVSIVVFIKYAAGEELFNQDIKQLDLILKDIKI